MRDAGAASRALARAGFAPTPQSVQSNPDGTPTGTGNVTAMFSRGYIEVLFKTADTPLGREFDLALAGHAGVHLAAFSVADAEGAHRRLTEAGFAMRPLVQFQRPVETVTGPGVAAFTVVRLERGAMAEGRIQILAHRTEDTVWQPRWLTHRNGALGLVDLVVACADVAEAAARFERFTGHKAQAHGVRPGGHRARPRPGAICSPATHSRRCFRRSRCPRLPFMGAYAVRVRSLAAVEALLKQEQHARCAASARRWSCRFPTSLASGAWLFVENAGDLPWRS